MNRKRVLFWHSSRVIFSLLLILLIGSAALCAASENPTISPQDWAYRALDEMAQRGLLAGYARAPLTGPQALTRFEAASLVLRAIEGVGKEYQESGQIIAQLAQAPTTETPAQPQAEQPPSPPTGDETKAVERGPGVYPEDIAMLGKLVAEFRAELAGMGIKVDELGKTLSATQKRLEKVENEQRLHQPTGYLQFRFTDDQAKTNNTFALRRIRFGMKGVLSPKASYAVMFRRDDSDKNVDLDDAYLDLTTGKTSRLRSGQAKLPVGYEVLESPSDRYEPESSVVMDRLFPKSRDIGMQWQNQSHANGPIFNLGIFNGTGINTSDDNNTKDVLGSVQIPFRGGSIFLSDYEGRTGSAGQHKNRLNGGLEWGNKTRLRAEYITGEDKGEDVLGWYARLSQPIGKTQIAYAKYEVFDENRSRADDLYRALGLGWVQELDARTRLTISWEHRTADKNFSELSTKNGDRTILQLQVKY